MGVLNAANERQKNGIQTLFVCKVGSGMHVKNGRHSLVHHDDGMPGVEHDETPLGARPLGVQGNQQVGCEALIMLYGMHDAQGNLNGHQVV